MIKRASIKRTWIVIALLLLLPAPGFPQAVTSGRNKAAAVKQLYDAKRWNAVVRLVPESPSEPADLELYRGLALAQLQRYSEAARTLAAGHAGHPRDPRFLVEMAGVAYHEKQFSSAKKELRHALAITPHDAYANNFLASIYFLEGNLEAALKYWNRVGKPKLSDLLYDPVPTLDPLLLDRAFQFSPGMTWTRDRYLNTQAQLKSLNLFPYTFYELQALPDGSFHLTWHDTERNNWRTVNVQTVATTLRGLPYQSVYPEFYNLNRKGLNWLSLVRWDDEKRRLESEIDTPIAQDPNLELRIFFDGRNENWDISRTLLPPGIAPASFNLRSLVIGVGLHSIVNWKWQWNADVEYSNRNFRTLVGIPPQAAPFFTNTGAVALKSSVVHPLIRFPERRFTLDASANGGAGKFYSSPLGQYARLQGSLNANWLPRAQGEDYGMDTRLRAGKTFGQIPFDDLFMLGFDRDNDLWMRGHNDLRNGKKGNAPLGREFILSNSDISKVVFNDSLFLVKVGPFLDTGDIYDPSQFFGSPKWLTDTGLQATVRVLGRFEFVLGYGKDLRSGNNTFYSTVSQ